MNCIVNYIKDLGPVIIALIALIVGSLNISKQVRKNTKVQWIDQFRTSLVKLMMNYYDFYNEYRKDGKIQLAYKELGGQILYIRLLLNRKDKKQSILYDSLSTLLEQAAKFNKNGSIDEMLERIDFIGRLAEDIIHTEQNKITNSFWHNFINSKPVKPV